MFWSNLQHTIFSIDKNIFHILDHTLSLLNSWLLASWERRKFHLLSPRLPLFHCTQFHTATV